jgi:hypothetical protein
MCESNEEYVPLNDGYNWKGDPNATLSGQAIPQLPPGTVPPPLAATTPPASAPPPVPWRNTTRPPAAIFVLPLPRTPPKRLSGDRR